MLFSRGPDCPIRYGFSVVVVFKVLVLGVGVVVLGVGVVVLGARVLGVGVLVLDVRVVDVGGKGSKTDPAYGPASASR